MVGHLPDKEDPDMTDRLEAENLLFGDLVSRAFVDTYRNLTLKAIMAYEWLQDFCPDVQIVVKLDDDVMINLDVLTRELSEPNILESANYFCHVNMGQTPNRKMGNLRYTTKEEYEGDGFPPFCAGFAYVTRVVRRVLGVLNHFDWFLWIDDVFLTGIAVTKYNEKIIKDSTAKNEENEESAIELIHKGNSTWFFWPDGVKEDKDLLLHWWIHPPLIRLHRANSENVKNPPKDQGSSKAQMILTKDFDHRIFFLIKHGRLFDLDVVRLWHKINTVINTPMVLTTINYDTDNDTINYSGSQNLNATD